MADIYWMVESIPIVLRDEQDVEFGRFLSPDECQTLKGLSVEKRRREWLAGRIAVKQLYLKLNNVGDELSSCSVEREETGAPYLMMNGVRVAGTVSISHSHGLVAVGYTPENMRIGIDIEEVKPRDEAFLADYFSDLEKDWVLSGNLGNPDLRLNLIWSAKESILKCLASGLGTDPLRVTINTPWNEVLSSDWNSLKGSNHSATGNQDWQIQWREWRDSVLSLCYPAGIQTNINEIEFSVLS